jgi:pimeloyl-ACP methyl ester carboxylesterase
MTIVLVHGVPETPAIWDPLRSRLGRDDVEALRLPGFGSPRPSGFGATKEEYVDWLVGELERLNTGGPVDLVGHDWGGGFVVRVVSTRPELIRSWVTDAAGVGDAGFEWHELAKVWQTPGAGEQAFEQWLAAPPEQAAAPFEQAGVPHEHAVAMLTEIDQTMADCILALYRSAVDVGREWAPDFRDIPSPGLAVIPAEDPFLVAESARNGARAANARVEDVPNLGHWWMLQDPEQGAAMLQRFWSSLTPAA